MFSIYICGGFFYVARELIVRVFYILGTTKTTSHWYLLLWRLLTLFSYPLWQVMALFHLGFQC